MRQQTKFELYQQSVHAAQAVLDQQNLHHQVRATVAHAVATWFADPSIAATALEPLTPDIRRIGAEAAADVAARTAVEQAGAVLADVREAIEKARDELAQRADEAVTSATTAAERDRQAAETAINSARDEACATAKQAAADAGTAVAKAHHDVIRAAESAGAEARELVEKSRAQALKATTAAIETARQTLESAREDVTKLAREAAERAWAEYLPTPIEVTLPNGLVRKVTGQTHHVLPEALIALGARCHVLLVGPAGTGKSTLATQAAAALGLRLQAISLGPTTPMSKVFGYFDAHGTYHDTPFRRAFEHGGVMLLDELDNGHPGLLAELNQALALGVCAFADGMVSAHDDFRLIATANTYGTGGDRQYLGRQALDAATLDRFVTIEVPVDEQLEERVAMGLAPKNKRQVRELLTEVRRLRGVAAEKRLPVMFSPRVSIDGAKLLAAGATLDQVMSWRVIRGLSDAHRTALGLTSSTEPAE